MHYTIDTRDEGQRALLPDRFTPADFAGIAAEQGRPLDNSSVRHEATDLFGEPTDRQSPDRRERMHAPRALSLAAGLSFGRAHELFLASREERGNVPPMILGETAGALVAFGGLRAPKPRKAPLDWRPHVTYPVLRAEGFEAWEGGTLGEVARRHPVCIVERRGGYLACLRDGALWDTVDWRYAYRARTLRGYPVRQRLTVSDERAETVWVREASAGKA